MREGPAGRLAALSHRALRYAAALQVPDATYLTGRLYRYHSLPATTALRRRLPGPEAVARALDADRSGRAAPPLQRGEDRVMFDAGPAIWRTWDHPDRGDPASSGWRPKLYVSPMLEGLGESVRALLDLFHHAHGPYSVKAGRDLPGILRPDKLVAYFHTTDDLFESAASLRRTLSGLRVHGVPFSAQLDDDGLLSWGADPPSSVDGPSWRALIANAAAATMATALEEGDPDPVQAGLDGIARVGVDVGDWTPTALRPG